MRQIVENGGLARNDAMRYDEALISLPRRLRVDIFERVDVADILELAGHAEPSRHGLSMLARAVREDEFASGQRFDRRRQFRGGGDRAQIDVMHIVEEGVGRDVMEAHQSSKGGAVLVVIGLAQSLRVFERDAEAVGDELAHAPVDLGEQIAIGGVEGVVEIEHPRLDMGEAEGALGLSDHCDSLAPLLRLRRSIKVPAPCSVNSSSSTACGTLPLMITTPSTPSAITSMQLSILGIMPPEIVPSSIRACASPVVRDLISCPFLSSTPSTSVKSNRRFAFRAEASAAAKVSSLMLRVSPSGPTTIGAITGIRSELMITSIICGSTATGSPTKPRSTICSILDVGSRQRRSSRLARIKLASLPEMPTALPPWVLMAVTISLLTEPASTISTTSTVSRSVTRKPPLNSDLILSRSSREPICGPPPCPTMGFPPACLSSTMSRAKSAASAGSPMAWPPYFTTTVFLS